MQDAAVDRLQPVARIGQRAMHDCGQRISEIALLERVLQRDILDVLVRRRNQPCSHRIRLARIAVANK